MDQKKEENVDRVDQDAAERREAYKRREREAIAEMAGEDLPEYPDEEKEQKQEE